jgi:hypothetical protein
MAGEPRDRAAGALPRPQTPAQLLVDRCKLARVERGLSLEALRLRKVDLSLRTIVATAEFDAALGRLQRALLTGATGERAELA